jgi:hypothetical protein
MMAAVLGLAPACLAQTNYPEIEPNDTKATATVVGAMAPGDTLTGNSTGSATTPGAASLDTWDVTTTAAPSPGIWQYQLNINEASGTGHTMTIRGLNQGAGVIGTVDSTAQTASPAISRSVRWYANEQPSRIYLRVTGTASTTADYVITLSRTQVTPTDLGNFDAGPLYVTTVGQSTTDTELWLYNSSFNPIVDAGNDDESTAEGGPNNTTQSRLQRNLPPGNYFLAIATQNMSNNLASPTTDRQRNRVVMDFPNAICTSSAPGTNDNHNFTIGNRCTGSSQAYTDNSSQHFLTVTFYSFTLTGTQLPDPVTFTAGSASPAGIGQGGSTLLTVTASSTLTAVTGDLSAFGLTSTEAFHDDGVNGDATAGDGVWSYQLAVPVTQLTGAYNINVVGSITGACTQPSRTITLNVTPPNNSCSNAVPISVGGAYPGTTIGAVAAGGLTTACNTVTGNSPGVWYVFTETSPTPRRLIATACDPATDFNAKMLLYTGTCGSLTCVWGNFQPGFGCPYQNPARDPGLAVSNSHTDIPAIINWSAGPPGYKPTVPGTTYYICVENEGAASGNFVLHLDDTGEDPVVTNPPSNDLCSGARDLATFQSGIPMHTGFPVWDLVFRDHATDDALVPCSDPTNTVSRGGIWYTYTPSQQGNLFHAKIPDQVNTGTNQPPGSSFDTVVTVFTGSCASGLTEVACVDAVEGFTNMFTTPVAALTAGTTYYIEVSSQSPTAAIPGGEYIGFNFVGTGPGPCCRSDFNGDGDVGTDADIEAFFSCLSGNCCATCPPNADFNCDGDVGTDTDIESFFRVLAGGAC